MVALSELCLWFFTLAKSFFFFSGRSPWLQRQQIGFFRSYSFLSLFPSFSLPAVLCDPTDLIWRKGTPFKAMTGCTASLSDCLLAEVSLSCKANARRSMHSSRDHFIVIFIVSERCGLWLVTRIGATGTATLE